MMRYVIFQLNKSFFEGIKSFFYPMNTRKSRINTILKTSDKEALDADWVVVGNDVRKAMNMYERYYEQR